MTEQDDELQDLFREKNLEDAFSPDEQNWKKMAAVLKDEQLGRRKILFYLSALLLSLGLVSAWFFRDASDHNSKALALKPREESTPLNNLKINKLPESKPTPKPVKILSEPKQTIKEINPVTTKQPSSPKQITSSPEIKQAEPSSALSYYEKIMNQEPVKMEIELRKVPTKQNAPEEKELAFAPSLNGKQTALLSSKNPDPLQNKSKTVFSSDENATGKQEDKKPELAGEPLNTQVSTSPFQPLLSEEKKPEQKNNEILTPASVSNSLTELSITEPATPPTVATEKHDSITTAVLLPKDSLPAKVRPVHYVSLEAGTSYLLGWKTNSKTEANGFNPLIGIQYYQEVSKKVGLSIGLQYTTINNLSSTSHTSSTSRVKFGEERDVTVISALNMNYLLMPLKLSYGFSDNDFISIGYTFAYLLDVKSKVETYSTGLGYSTTPVVSKSMGYSKGFSPYDGQIAFSYRRRLYKAFYVNGEFFYGLRDLKNNSTYQLNEFERACGFRLSLGFNLWKK